MIGKRGSGEGVEKRNFFFSVFCENNVIEVMVFLYKYIFSLKLGY